MTKNKRSERTPSVREHEAYSDAGRSAVMRLHVVRVPGPQTRRDTIHADDLQEQCSVVCMLICRTCLT